MSAWACDFDPSRLAGVLKQFRSANAVMLVGHEPSMNFARAFERSAPLPGSLAAFVFGVEVLGDARVAQQRPDDERVCVCNEVSRGEIRRAIEEGARDVSEISRRTLAGTGCGTCRGELAALVIAAAERRV